MAGMNVRDDILSQIPKPKPSGRDLAYRAVAAVFGGPVDLTAMVMKPFGYGVEKPVLGSEWIGQQMQDVGLVSEARDPLQEFMASLLVPGGGIEAVPALAGKGMAMLPAAMGVVKGKGGNWLTGSVEEALKPLKKPITYDDVRANGRVMTRENAQRLQRSAPAHEALNSWIEGPLTKYVKTRMASPDDEIRKLADQGVLHYDPPAANGITGLEDRYATSNLGASFEDQADTFVNSGTARDFIGNSNFPESQSWLSNIAPDTPIYWTSGQHSGGGDLGFRHLTDELSNALNPESGLPRALQLSPDQMKNLSVEKAVRRVADINKWRANQMAEANKAIAFDEKTAPIFKEYQTVPGHGNGQPNEKGLHWREIKDSPDGGLENQLAYEGDTMGHCVGGYCDDVASGRSKVYTLRDKTGKPHVTIEVAPRGTMAIPQNDIAEEAMMRAEAELGEDADYEDLVALAETLVPEIEKEARFAANRIVQIKGAKNSAPKDEYVPFIQDFIRSGKFSDVGDLKHAQLKKASQTFNETELKTLERHGAKLTGEEYLTYAEVEALQSLFKSK